MQGLGPIRFAGSKDFRTEVLDFGQKELYALIGPEGLGRRIFTCGFLPGLWEQDFSVLNCTTQEGLRFMRCAGSGQ